MGGTIGRNLRKAEPGFGFLGNFLGAAAQLTLAAVIAWIAWHNLADLRVGADIVALDHLLGSRDAFRQPLAGADLLSNVRSVPQDLSRFEGMCVGEISKAADDIRLVRLEAARALTPDRVPALRAEALAAMEARLVCVPTDGGAWFQRAKLLDEAEAPKDDVVSALRLSYRHARHEGWLMLRRFAFVSGLIETGKLEVTPDFTGELSKLTASLEPEAVAELYVGCGPIVRPLFLEPLRRLPPDRLRRFSLEVDRLGVAFHLSP